VRLPRLARLGDLCQLLGRRALYLQGRVCGDSRQREELLAWSMGPVYEPVWYPAAYRGRYPHMAKRDAAVWETFLEAYSVRFEAFAYDVALGGILLDMPDLTVGDAAGWQYTTALRIDAVAREGDRYWIIEVRPEAHVSALGAALCYTLVAKRDAAFPGALLPAVVCTYMQPDVKWVADNLGITVFQVPGD